MKERRRKQMKRGGTGGGREKEELNMRDSKENQCVDSRNNENHI